MIDIGEVMEQSIKRLLEYDINFSIKHNDILTKLEPFDLLIFDLDNTLYNEYSFLAQSYKQFLKSYELSQEIFSEIYIFMLDLVLLRSDRKKLVQKVNKKFKLNLSIDRLYAVMRDEFHGELKLFSGAENLLKDLQKSSDVYLLTNGNPLQQKIKGKRLNLFSFIDINNFICASDIEPKPSAEGIKYILNHSSCSIQRTAFIGDSEIDKIAAEKLYIKYFDINSLS